MVVVREMPSVLFTILGTQDADASKEYRKLSFCLVTEADGTFVACNLLTGELLEVTAEEAEALGAPSVSVNEVTKPLIAKWFLVPVDHDDIQLADETIGFFKLFQQEKGIKNYTIFTTMDCNARCFYCYELGRKRTPMSLDTARDVVEFIAKTATTEKEIKLSWFGGEPLYNAEIIDVITEALGARGIPYKSHVTSNGYLFDAETAKKAAEKWNVKTVQITLDGTEQVYNKAKAYIYDTDASPFYTVTDNIEHLLKNGIVVQIRLNVGEHNRENLYQLVDWLAERYAGYDKLKVYMHLLFETDPQKLALAKRVQLTEEMCALERHCMEKGLLLVGTLSADIKTNCCMADAVSAVAILPNGKLVKCEHFTDDNIVGSIYDGITDHALVEKFMERDNSKEMCAGCVAYPRCVRLKMCPNYVEGLCDAGERLHMRERFLRALVKTYRILKEKKKAE